MQNLKSLENLLTAPTLGANDDTNAMVGRPKMELYSYEDELKDILRKVDEPHRKALSREFFPPSKQD